MGMDIHMFIVNKDKEVIDKEIFGGRNSEWFQRLLGNRNNVSEEYKHFPSKSWESELPEELKFFSKDNYFFGHFKIKVSDFKKWYDEYQPTIDAGWADTYTLWKIRYKKYKVYDLPKTKPDGEDWHFITYDNNEEDCSDWLKNYLDDNSVEKDSYIYYCFDN